MNKLSKEKRTHLILAVLGIVLVLAGVWYFLISEQQAGIARLEVQKAESGKKLRDIRETFKNKEHLAAELVAATQALNAREAEMASGDLYAWMVSTLRRFKQPYGVDIPQIASPAVGNVSLFAKFPYKQAATSVTGTAYYHELGRFVADFENQFPSARVLNLNLVPATASASEQEKLSFKMDLVWLVKPDSGRLASNP